MVIITTFLTTKLSNDPTQVFDAHQRSWMSHPGQWIGQNPLWAAISSLLRPAMNHSIKQTRAYEASKMFIFIEYIRMYRKVIVIFAGLKIRHRNIPTGRRNFPPTHTNTDHPSPGCAWYRCWELPTVLAYTKLSRRGFWLHDGIYYMMWFRKCLRIILILKYLC